MATIDPRFFCTSDLDTYYVDNASGLPMSGGIVTFYSDVNRTVLKPVYQLTGTPGNYSYAPLNNPCTLSSSGTFQDAMGNNIVPYYYPFTGLPSDNNNQGTGVSELYYITVVNSGFVPQFTRQGWPQAAATNVTPVNDEEVDNFIPNGQFLAHTNWTSLTEPPVTPSAGLSFAGGQTIDTQPIAQGGWYFAYTNGTTATFANSFSQIPASGGWGAANFPRYLFNFVCASVAGMGGVPATRDLWITWPDVNKFSSSPGPYTLYFDAKSNDGNAYTFTLYQIYYFGSGSSSPGLFSAPIATITIGPSGLLQSHNIQNITWLVNQGTIGSNNDDFVGIAIRGPSSAWNVSLSDFVLAQGNEVFTSFPVETNDQMLSRGVAGFMPTPNPTGADLYLPLVLTPQGLTFDHSQVGLIESCMEQWGANPHPTTNLILCDGSQYLTSGYSPIGIPYSRLQSFLFSNGLGTSVNVPIFGTGTTYSTAYVSSAASSGQIMLVTNQTGNQTSPADGTAATGFTFGPQVIAGTTSIGFTAWSNSGAWVTASSSTFLTPANAGASAGNSGFTVVQPENSTSTGLTYSILINTIAASGLAGKYFQFSNSSTNYYIWFTVNGAGADPAPGGTGIRVALKSTMTAEDVAMCVATAMAANQMDLITIASTPPASSYFTFFANGLKYTVWYTVDSVGVQPVVASTANYINVSISSTATNAQIAAATQIAINSLYFAVPDLRGVFLRGATTSKWDTDTARRFAYAFNLPSTNVGTFELDAFASHNHAPTGTPNSGTPAFVVDKTTGGITLAGAGSTTSEQLFTAFSGGTENRPVNVFVNFAIRY